MEAEEAELMLLEPTQLLDYIRQLFFQMVRIKNDVLNEFEERMEIECATYEPQLQKYEADIREHIKVWGSRFHLKIDKFCLKIEQQMKLYAESLQEKLDEYEKGRGSSDKVDQKLIEVKNMC